eukprot:509283-Prymnesium_polylepis.1
MSYLNLVRSTYLNLDLSQRSLRFKSTMNQVDLQSISQELTRSTYLRRIIEINVTGRLRLQLYHLLISNYLDFSQPRLLSTSVDLHVFRFSAALPGSADVCKHQHRNARSRNVPPGPARATGYGQCNGNGGTPRHNLHSF